MALGLSYAFDAGKETPQDIARRRAIAEAILGKSTTPKNVGEGWGAIAKGLVANVQNGRANQAERVGQEGASDLYNSIVSGITGGSPAVSSAMPGAAQEMSATSPASRTASAPTSFGGNQQEFVQSLLPAAIEESKRTGVDPRIIVAQASLESGYGKHAPGGNLFGIKSHGQDGGNSLMTTEVIDGKTVRQRDSFRAYGSPEESVRGYGDFILQNPRYGKMRSAQGLDNQIAELQASGYATDPDYGAKIGSIARGIQLPQEVASLDQSAGMSAAQAIDAVAPQQAPFRGSDYNSPMTTYDEQGMRVERPYSDPTVSAPNAMQQPQQAAIAPSQPMAPQLPPPSTIQSPPAGAQPQKQMAQAQPMGGGVPLEALMQAAGNPFLSEQQRSVVNLMLQQRLQENDPVRQMQLQKGQMELDAMRNPQPDYDMISGKDGSIFRADKRSGSVEQVYGGKKETYRPLSNDEEQQMGLDPAQAYQIGPDNKVYKIGGEGTTVNIDQRAEGAFDKKLAEAQATTFDAMATEGLNARADLGVINELDTLLQGQGGTLSGLSGALAKYGIGGEGVDDLQAAQALINKLVPSQRAPGSGSMSDRDVELFSRSLPSLWNAPGGNQKIIGVMRGLTEYKTSQGEIADQVLAGEMTRQEARRALRALPNPLADLKPIGSGTKAEKTPAENPLPPQPQSFPNAPAVGVIEDGYRFKGGNPADQANWERVM